MARKEVCITRVRTTISLDESLFQRVEALAKEMSIPRSRLFALAVEEFIARRGNEELRKAINASTEDASDAEEEAAQQAMRDQHRSMVQGEW